jgi:methylenetetrahydrofolate dehydrogenase (NADP+)/methenyltetrahydrofolate cyclohydrolase
MTAKIIDGRKLSQDIREKILEETALLKKERISPCLATVLVGEDAPSMLYLRIKHRSCEKVGIKSVNHRLPTQTTQTELLELIRQLNNDQDVHGILVQMPLPEHIDNYSVVNTIDPKKDVDGLHPFNLGCISYRRYKLTPCTPMAIMVMLSQYGISIEGKHAVIINRSTLVGKPLNLLLSRVEPAQMLLFDTDILLLNADATVTTCHSKTQDLDKFTRDADILISAVGQRRLEKIETEEKDFPKNTASRIGGFVIKGEMIKENAAVFDVGVSRIEGKVYGDLDFESVVRKAAYVTPNPGGVGPMTVTMLLYNTLIATGLQNDRELKYGMRELLQS